MTVRTKTPQPVDLKEGKSYLWCACSLSQAMPLCDRSYKETNKEQLTVT